MSLPEITKKLKEKNLEYNNSDLIEFIKIFFEGLENALLKSQNVELRGFGTFFIKKIKEKYSARNPKTGELIYVPEKNKVRFRASKKFKDFINNEKN